jgi:hypothetical protein
MPKAGKDPSLRTIACSTLLVRVYMPSLARVSSSSRPVTFKPSAFW